MTKYIIGGIVLILLAVGGGYYLETKNASSVPAPVAQQPEAQPFVASTSTYASSSYSIVYPNEFTKNENYVNTAFGPKKPILGVQFTIPESMATGTNLAMNDTGVSVEQLPRAQKCTGDIYIFANVKAQAVTENGVNYSVASSTEGAASSTYEEIVYALADSKPCTALRYRIHSAQIGNFPPNTVREFYRSALLSAFDGIRQSLVLTH